MLLKDKVVLVTGSTTGIGAAIARTCWAHGASVMIHGRNEERAAEMCREVPERMHYVLSDLAAVTNGDEMIQAVVSHYGRFDVLINNAGQSPRNRIDSITPEQFDWVVGLNARAPLFLSQAAVKQFRAQTGGGVIVNIGSINAYCGESQLLGYSMTKGALMTMTRNLGNALCAEGIRVNQLNVGWTLTPNESDIKQNEGFPEEWESYIPDTYAPSGRLLRPEDIAEHAVFWASDKSAPANGVVYEVEQYPVVGRNLINTIPLDVFEKKSEGESV